MNIHNIKNFLQESGAPRKIATYRSFSGICCFYIWKWKRFINRLNNFLVQSSKTHYALTHIILSNLYRVWKQWFTIYFSEIYVLKYVVLLLSHCFFSPYDFLKNIMKNSIDTKTTNKLVKVLRRGTNRLAKIKCFSMDFMGPNLYFLMWYLNISKCSRTMAWELL